MAIQEAVKNLKENGSKDDKVAVASGIAVSVVVVLLGAWAIYFLHSLASNSQKIQLGGGAADRLNMTDVQQAQQQLQQQFGSTTEDMQTIYQQSSTGDYQTSGAVQMQTQGDTGNQFGPPDSSY
jgi:hypothetical protein